MAFDFSRAFTVTDAAFGQAGTYYSANGTKAGTALLIFEEMGGAVVTAEGVMMPDAPSMCHITKTNLGTLSPVRGALLTHGTDTYDIVEYPQQDPTRGEWIVMAKRRA